MKKHTVIIAIIVGLTSAQGVQSQETTYQSSSDLKNYIEIPIVEVPINIQEFVVVNYNEYWISKAYKNVDKDIFKLELKKTNNQTQVIFANAEGKLVKLNNESKI
ncbi:hypothetical protein [Aquimarina rhabdastrellae]